MQLSLRLPLALLPLALLGATSAVATRDVRARLLDHADWRFYRGDEPLSGSRCSFSLDLGQTHCGGLIKVADVSVQVPQTSASCAASCCRLGDSCDVFSFCPKNGSCSGQDTGIPGLGMQGCWVGTRLAVAAHGEEPASVGCNSTTAGWITRARPVAPVCAAGRFCATTFADSQWRSVDLPHDWSIEDLPARADDQTAPVLGPRYGTWAFHEGDECGANQTCACCGSAALPDPHSGSAVCVAGCVSVPPRANASFDDSAWQRVKGGQDWRVHSNFTAQNATGWYRQLVDASELFLKQTVDQPLILDLGVISGADFTYLNGQLIGSTGSWGNPGCDDYETWRRYPVPPSLLKPTGNLIAVRIFSKGGPGWSPLRAPFGFPGGMFDDPALGPDVDVRSGPFDAGASVNGQSLGYAVGGIGWYRTAFETPAAATAEATSLDFDGVYEESDVYVNGVHVGHHPYGYTGFEYEVAEFLNPPGQNNSLAVRVANLGKNSRWYSGSGIYRHVRLRSRPTAHLTSYGVRITTTEIKRINASHASEATVVVVATVQNVGADPVHATVVVAISGFSASQMHGTTAQVSVAANATKRVSLNVSVTGLISLWAPDTPDLYNATVSLTTATAQAETDGGAGSSSTVLLDEEEPIAFGFRSLEFDSENGFRLNGVETKLYGGCVHHANGPLGAAAVDRAEERRVELLKAQGYNAIRTSHNPPSPQFLDACDRLGVMVMCEAFDTWPEGKNADDYHVNFDRWWRRDLTAMVTRHWNHASIVLWSIGNEIPSRSTPLGANLSVALSALVKELDAGSGRAVTAAYPAVDENADPFFAPLDVAGYNYSPQRYYQDHTRQPARVMVGTESDPTMSFAMWQSVWNNTWVIGDFIWTAMDYLGESAIGFETQTDGTDECDASEPFPFHVSFCGDLDLVGMPKPQAMYRTVLWDKSLMELAVHVPMPDGHDERVGGWGWPEERASWSWANSTAAGPGMVAAAGVMAAGGEEAEAGGCPCWPCPCRTQPPPLRVNVYTKHCDSVVLLLDGKPLGPPTPSSVSSQYTATFNGITFAPGNLTAVGTRNGSACARKTLLTAGRAASLKLEADRPLLYHHRNDLAFVTVTAFDSEGVAVPDADNRVEFTLSPSNLMEISAVGSGDPRDVSSLTNSSSRKLWRGKALVILRPVAGQAPGAVKLTARAQGLPATTLELHTKSPA